MPPPIIKYEDQVLTSALLSLGGGLVHVWFRPKTSLVNYATAVFMSFIIGMLVNYSLFYIDALVPFNSLITCSAAVFSKDALEVVFEAFSNRMKNWSNANDPDKHDDKHDDKPDNVQP